MNKLFRSRSDRIFAGVCGGLSHYFEVDSTLFRLLFVFLWIVTGIVPLSIGYLLAILIIPIEPMNQKNLHPRIFYRSKNNKMIAGICGALGESWDVDPTIIRLLTTILCLITGILPVVIIYCFGWILIPQKSNG